MGIKLRRKKYLVAKLFYWMRTWDLLQGGDRLKFEQSLLGYCMSKKSWIILCNKLLYKKGIK